MPHLCSFDTAVSSLLADPMQTSFAFVPLVRPVGIAVGGTIFTLSIREDDPTSPCIVLSAATRFFRSSGDDEEEEVYPIADLATNPAYFKFRYGLDPRTLLFKPCSMRQLIAASDLTAEYALAALNGQDAHASDQIASLPDDWLHWLTQHLPGETKCG